MVYCCTAQFHGVHRFVKHVQAERDLASIDQQPGGQQRRQHSGPDRQRDDQRHEQHRHHPARINHPGDRIRVVVVQTADDGRDQQDRGPPGQTPAALTEPQPPDRRTPVLRR